MAGMKIISDFNKDTQSDKPIPGSYEWWYFDAQTADGYSLVVIFYDGNPFSRRYIESLSSEKHAAAGQFPAISISIYKNSTPLFYCFEEVEPGEASFSSLMPEGSVLNNRFEGTMDDKYLAYSIRLNHIMVNGDSITGNLQFNSKLIRRGLQKLFSGSEYSKHTWNLVQPACLVSGELKLGGSTPKTITIDGWGYHDHNRGEEPMKESFDEWYWGRYHFSNTTLVYYLMRENKHWDKKAWLIDKSGSVIPMSESISLNDKSTSIFGLSSSRKIEFNTDRHHALLQLDEMIDNGPFYQRFNGRIVLKMDEKIEQARGISEYIYPSRIYNKLFWPLVNMRIKYPGKAHWVQKSPILYRWTW